MEETSGYELKKIDSQKLAEMAKDRPELAMPESHPQFTAEFLPKIGIDLQKEKCGKGYIKLYPADFIVEEITQSYRVVNIAPGEENLQAEPSPNLQTGAELVKEGIDTFEAAQRIAKALNIDPASVKSAGLKDSKAITAQTISISNVTPEQVRELQIPNLFLKNIRQRKGTIETGSLFGNKFTIVVRTDKKNNAKVIESVQAMKAGGFYNFFSLQRFGPRMINTDLGRLILEEKFEEAVKMFLTAGSPNEILALKNIRSLALAHWGNWPEMRREFFTFPYFFRYEIKILDSLAQNGKFVLALKEIQDQTKIFVYAYCSYWFNKLLSSMISSSATLPETLPMLSSNEEVKNQYASIIPKEELDSLVFAQPTMPFIDMNKVRQVPARIKPEIYRAFELPFGYIFSFSLGKGAYATTMLAELFDLYQGSPVPEWVAKDEIDSKKSLGEVAVSLTQAKITNEQNSAETALGEEIS